MYVAVVGQGCMGVTAAWGLAEAGHTVTGVECDPGRLEILREGRPPIYEPALAELMQPLMARGVLSFVGSVDTKWNADLTAVPHDDRIDQETDAPEIAGFTDRLVANMYLQVPDDGGDLQLWLRNPTDEEQAVVMEVEGLDPRLGGATAIDDPLRGRRPHHLQLSHAAGGDVGSRPSPRRHGVGRRRRDDGGAASLLELRHVA